MHVFALKDTQDQSLVMSYFKVSIFGLLIEDRLSGCFWLGTTNCTV